jgi:hypothetical protein
MISYQWRGDFASAEVEALHADGFGRAPADHDWKAQVQQHSLGWVCARRGGELAGFVNVAWDGGVHAFILDTVVAGPLRRYGVGTRLVEVARPRGRRGRVRGCRSTSRITWARSTSAAGSGPRTPASPGWAQTPHQSGEAHPVFSRPSRPRSNRNERALPPIDTASILRPDFVRSDRTGRSALARGFRTAGRRPALRMRGLT